MPECPKCKKHFFYNNKCNKCGYYGKGNLNISNNEQKVNIVKCLDCEKEISVNADACPHCGAPTRIKLNKKSVNSKIYIILAIIILVIFFLTSDTGKMMFNSKYKECRKVLNETLCREAYIYR